LAAVNEGPRRSFGREPAAYTLTPALSRSAGEGENLLPRRLLAAQGDHDV